MGLAVNFVLKILRSGSTTIHFCASHRKEITPALSHPTSPGQVVVVVVVVVVVELREEERADISKSQIDLLTSKPPQTPMMEHKRQTVPSRNL